MIERKWAACRTFDTREEAEAWTKSGTATYKVVPWPFAESTIRFNVPTEPGFYLTGHSGLMVLGEDGIWRGTYSNARRIEPEHLPHDLVRMDAVESNES